MMIGLLHEQELRTFQPVLWVDARRTNTFYTNLETVPQIGSAPATVTQPTISKQPLVGSVNAAPVLTLSFDNADDCLIVDPIDLTHTQAVTMVCLHRQIVATALGSVIYEISSNSETQEGGAAMTRGYNTANSREAGCIVRGDVGTNYELTFLSPDGTRFTGGQHIFITTHDFTQPAATELGFYADGQAVPLVRQITGPSENTGFFKNLPSYIGNRNNGSTKPFYTGAPAPMMILQMYDRALTDDQKAVVETGVRKVFGTGNQSILMAGVNRNTPTLYTFPSATVVIGAGQVNQVAVIALPFPFQYDYQVYTQVTVSSNGFVCLGAVDPSDVPTDKSAWGSAANPPLMAPWWDNLKTAEGSGYVRWVLQGSAPTRIFHIEWLCYANVNQTALNNDTIRFQFSIAENGNTNFQYAAYSTTGTPDRSGYGAATGVQGTSAGATARFWNMQNPDGAPMDPAKAWPTGFASSTGLLYYPYAATMAEDSSPRTDLILRNDAGNLDWPGNTNSRASATAYRILTFPRGS